MRIPLSSVALAVVAAILVPALSADEALAQGAGTRNSLNQSQSGSLRNTYSGGISGSRDGISTSSRFGGGATSGRVGA